MRYLELPGFQVRQRPRLIALRDERSERAVASPLALGAHLALADQNVDAPSHITGRLESQLARRGGANTRISPQHQPALRPAGSPVAEVPDLGAGRPDSKDEPR